MATLAAYPAMMRRDRERLGLRECRAASLLGITVREYRQLEAGDAGVVTADLWERMIEVFGWPGVVRKAAC
jgi:hypothetical protein